MLTFLSNSAAGVIARGFSLALQLTLVAILVRVLGTQAYGLLVLAIGLAGNTNLLEGAFGQSATKHIAEYLARGDEDAVAEAVTTNLLLAAAQIALFAVVFFAIDRFWLEAIFTLPTGVEGQAHRMVRVFIGVMALDLLASSLIRIGEGYQDFVGMRSLDAAKQVVRFALVAAAAGAGLGVERVAVAYLVASGLMVVASATYLRARGRLPLSLTFVRVARLIEMSRLSTGIFLHKVAAFFGNRADVFIIGHVLGTTGLAYYHIAFKFYEIFGQLLSTLSTAVMPYVADRAARGDLDRVHRLFELSTKYVFIVAVPPVLLTATFCRPLIEAWVGRDATLATAPALAYLASMLFLALPGAAANILLGLGRWRTLLTWQAAGSAASVALSVLLVPRMGVVGAALGSMVGAATIGLGYHGVAARRLVRHWRPFSRRVLGHYLGPALVTMAMAVMADGAGVPTRGVVTGVVLALTTGWWLRAETRRDVARAVAAVTARIGRRPAESLS